MNDWTGSFKKSILSTLVGERFPFTLALNETQVVLI